MINKHIFLLCKQKQIPQKKRRRSRKVQCDFIMFFLSKLQQQQTQHQGKRRKNKRTITIQFFRYQSSDFRFDCIAFQNVLTTFTRFTINCFAHIIILLIVHRHNAELYFIRHTIQIIFHLKIVQNQYLMESFSH